MSFNEFPIVDDNAKASEESVLAVRGLFSKKNGFICREEFPDYGTDLDVELILQGSEASSRKFPIQIKSSATFKSIQISNERFISEPFPTSRLRYLCERPPTYGIIIFYDDNEKTCHYGFVENIVQKLTSDRGNDDWKSKKTVNIHISNNNLLTAESVLAIHQQFSNRFDAQNLLILNHGHKYEIPSLTNSVSDDEISQMQPAEILKKYGLLFINEDDIHVLYSVLSEVSMHEILFTKELTFIASVVYAEIGKCLEADLFLNKAFQRINQYTVSESETLKFTRIKVDFLLGKRSREEYAKDLTSITEATKNNFNALLLRINLSHYTIIQKIEAKQLDSQLEAEIIELFSVINNADISLEQKFSLKVFQSENLQMYISSQMLQWVNELRFKESLKVQISQTNRNQMFEKSNGLMLLATQQVLAARAYALQEGKKFLQAHAEYALARFFFVKEFDFLLLHFKDDKPDKEEDFRRMVALAINAHSIFLEKGLIKHTRLALICLYDLKRIAKLVYGINVQVGDATDEILLNQIRLMNQEMGITKPFVSTVERAYADFVQMSSKIAESTTFKNLNDQEIIHYANTVLEVYQLPKERLVNLIDEMKAYRYFESQGNTDDFQLLTDLKHRYSEHDRYASPTSYIIVSKKTGMHSLPSLDVVKLATEFGALRNTQ